MPPNPPVPECLNYLFLFLQPWKHASYTHSSFFLIIGNQIELITPKLCYENSAQYNDKTQYYATFKPYAENLFGEQKITCKIDILVNYSNLYYYISGGRGYFS